MLVSPAYAQAAGAGGGDLFVSLMPLVLIFIVFYFLLIRPQQTKLKQHRALIEAIKKGDQVLTAGGIVGRVVRVDPDGMLLVEIAQGVQVKVARATITDLVNKPAPGNDNSKGATQGAAPVAGGFLGKLFKR
jgi:preprotein translocase subunit YajC